MKNFKKINRKNLIQTITDLASQMKLNKILHTDITYNPEKKEYQGFEQYSNDRLTSIRDTLSHRAVDYQLKKL